MGYDVSKPSVTVEEFGSFPMEEPLEIIDIPIKIVPISIDVPFPSREEIKSLREGIRSAILDDCSWYPKPSEDT